MTIEEIIHKINKEKLSEDEGNRLLKSLRDTAEDIIQNGNITVCINLAVSLKDVIGVDSLITSMISNCTDLPMVAAQKYIEEEIDRTVGNTAWFEVELIKD